MVKKTLRVAVQDATQWLVIGVAFGVVTAPLAWLFHRPAFNGLVGLWWHSPHKLAFTGVVGATMVGSWLVLVLLFWALESLKWAMGRHDKF
ncbi:MAG TPA: hypothetical protein H9875_03910 [Candidatus Levilactobacillus faecigallinarum]|uniref:Uncharacterized protein n=1 Tax=Candidatus Levilactobacillus faecigallinarum TaxID=2838638 RepID=A0A9D1QS05_9LACO|nr:hypothetical protein [Candidatus Levilactobacillus faecigallinarum]